jgi:hypothetical protein
MWQMLSADGGRGSRPRCLPSKCCQELGVHHGNHLCELFPQRPSQLQVCNLDRQLTAAAAFKYPWFAKVDALEQWRKEDVSSAALSNELLITPPDSLKRQQLHSAVCVILRATDV